MPRVKIGTTHVKKRKKLRKAVKGYRWSRKSTIRLAKTAVKKAGTHALRARRQKKAVSRALWNVRLNAAVREYGLTYSRFIDALKKKNILLDRKVLSELAIKYPAVFKAIVDLVK